MTISRISMAEYLSLVAFSASRCHTLLSYSPYHAKYGVSTGPSEISEIGTAIHDGLLEGVDRIVSVPFDDWRTKAAKEAREAARADGNIPLLARKVDQVVGAVEAVRGFMATSELQKKWFGVSESEVTITWDEEGVPCKARPDWLSGDHSLMIHLKSSDGSAEPNTWIRNQLVPRGYDIAAAFYERALNKQTRSVFLVIEQNPPHGCSLVGLSPAMMDLASRKVERAIKIWRECEATGKYPCYPPLICYAEPKPWELAEQEERELVDSYDEQQAKHGIQA